MTYNAHERGLVIDSYNTFTDWGLTLEAKEMPPAEPKTYTIDIEGGHGVIDLSDSLMGDVAYNSRTLTFTFVLTNTQLDPDTLRNTISAALNGRKKDFICTWDEQYTLSGRFIIGDWSSENGVKKIIFTVEADPFRVKRNISRTVNASKPLTVTIESGRIPVCPTFTAQVPFEISKGDTHVSVDATGTFRLPEIWLTEGNNNIWLSARLGEDGTTTYSDLASFTWTQLSQKKISDWAYNSGSPVDDGKRSIVMTYDRKEL